MRRFKNQALTQELKTRAKTTLDKTIGQKGDKRFIAEIRVADIDPNPDQPRQDLDPEAEVFLLFAEDIADRGLKEPIRVVRQPDNPDRYYPVDGHRRLLAHQVKEIEIIEAIVESYADMAEVTEETLLANFQRVDLNPIDAAAAGQRLKKEHKFTDEVLGRRFNLSRPSVTQLLSLNRLPQDIKDEYRALNNPEITKSMLLEIVQVKGAEDRRTIWDEVKKGGRTVREIRKAREAKHKKTPRPKVSNKDRTIVNAQGLRKRLEATIQEGAQLDEAYYQQLSGILQDITTLLEQWHNEGKE